MAQPFLILQDVDVRKAEVAGSGRPLTIAKMIIPPVRFKTMMRSAGGGVVDIDYSQDKLQPIEPGLTVFGFDRDFMPGVKDRWTFAASMRERKSGRSISVRSEIEGVIVDWSPDEADPAQFNGCNHAIKEVTHFELTIDNEEWWYVDEDERIIRRMGVELTAGRRRALGS